MPHGGARSPPAYGCRGRYRGGGGGGGNEPGAFISEAYAADRFVQDMGYVDASYARGVLEWDSLQVFYSGMPFSDHYYSNVYINVTAKDGSGKLLGVMIPRQDKIPREFHRAERRDPPPMYGPTYGDGATPACPTATTTCMLTGVATDWWGGSVQIDGAGKSHRATFMQTPYFLLPTACTGVAYADSFTTRQYDPGKYLDLDRTVIRALDNNADTHIRNRGERDNNIDVVPPAAEDQRRLGQPRLCEPDFTHEVSVPDIHTCEVRPPPAPPSA